MKTWALILDVFRQSRASAMFGVLIGLSVLAAVGLGGVGFDGDRVTYMWMKTPWIVPLAEQPSMVKTILAQVDGAMLGWIGMILMVVATGYFWPGFLNKGWVLLTLSKPISRPAIFAGRVVGATMFVAFQASFFAVLTLTAVGLRTGYWVVGHLAVAPIMVAIFLIIYSVSSLIGVLSRSTVFAILAALFFWFLCSTANNVGRAMDKVETYAPPDGGPRSVVAESEPAERVPPQTRPGQDTSAEYAAGGAAQHRVRSDAVRRSPGEPPAGTTNNATWWGKAIHITYMVLPKTSDLDLLMREAIYDSPPRSEDDTFIARIERQEAAGIDYRTSVLTTTAAVLLLFGMALWRFYRTDY